MYLYFLVVVRSKKLFIIILECKSFNLCKTCQTQSLSQMMQQQFLGFVEMYLLYLGYIFAMKVSESLLQKTFHFPPIVNCICSEIYLDLAISHLQISPVQTARIMLSMEVQLFLRIPLPLWPILEISTLSELKGSARNMQLYQGKTLSTPGVSPAQRADWHLNQVLLTSQMSPFVCWITENPQILGIVSFILSEMQSRRCFVSFLQKELAELMKLRNDCT